MKRKKKKTSTEKNITTINIVLNVVATATPCMYLKANNIDIHVKNYTYNTATTTITTTRNNSPSPTPSTAFTHSIPLTVCVIKRHKKIWKKKHRRAVEKKKKTKINVFILHPRCCIKSIQTNFYTNTQTYTHIHTDAGNHLKCW